LFLYTYGKLLYSLQPENRWKIHARAK
jgi:hypothetical protein